MALEGLLIQCTRYDYHYCACLVAVGHGIFLDSALSHIQLDGPSPSWSGTKGTLQYICDALLSETQQPSISMDFNDLLSSKVAETCRKCKQAIDGLVGSAVAENVADCLQSIRPMLEVLAQCQLSACAFLQHIVKCAASTSDSLPADALGHAVVLALEMAYEALQHCQESGSSYGLLFSSLESELLDVFLQGYNSLKVCFNHLEQLTASEGTDRELLLHVWQSLQQVAGVSVHFDNTLMVKSWRHLLKFCGKLSQDIKEELKIGPSLDILSETLVDRLRTCVASAASSEEVASQPAASLSKVVSFLSSALATVIQHFPELSDDEYRLLLDTVLVANSCCSSLYCCPTAGDSSCLALLAAVKQLTATVLTRLVKSWEQVLAVLVELANEQDADKLVGVLFCTLWFFENFSQLPDSVKERLILPASHDQVESSQFPLLELLFQVLPYCQVQLNLSSGFGFKPVDQSSDDTAPRQSSLYQHTYGIVTDFVVSLTSREFMACFEWGLLQQVLDAWHPVCSMLTRDLFIFLSRLGTSSLRVSYVLFIVKLIHSLPASLHRGYQNLLSLARSLFSLLSEKECTVAWDRLAQLTSEEKSVVWSLVDMTKLPETRLLQAIPGVVIPIIRHLTYWQQQTTADPAEIISVVEIMANICSDLRCLEAMPAGQRSSLCQLVVPLWRRLTEFVCDVDKVSETALRASQLLLEWCSYLIPVMATSEVRSLLLLYHDHLLSCPHPDILAGLPSIIAAWGRRELPPEVQEEFLDLLGSLCQASLSSPHWSVHQNALVAFTAFAKVTPYAEAVETKFMPQDLSEAVVAYLQQLPHDANVVSHQNVEKLAAIFKTRQQELVAKKCEADASLEPHSHMALKASLQSICTNLETVSTYLDSSQGALPDWLASQLTSTHKHAGMLVEKVNSINACAAVGSQIIHDIDDED